MSYLKTKPGSLEEAIRKHDENYKALFKKELDKAGKSIGQMTPDEKKKFFNKIDKMHTAKNEAKVDELTKAQKKLPPALQKAIKKKEMKEEQISEMKKVEIKLHPQNIDNTIQKIVKHIDIINRNRVQSKKIDVQQNMSDDSVTLIGRGGSDVGREVADIRNFIGFKSAKVIESVEEGKMSDLMIKIDDIANAMKKDRNMKPFVDKFKKDARKTLDPKKSLEKVLPDYIPGRDVEKLKNMAEQIDERMKTPRQLINPNKEVMIVKNNKVIVIDKKDQDKYMKKGWELAEKLDKEDEPKVKEIIKMLKKASNAHAGQAKDLEKAVNERELTPRELKRREEIAKKLDLKDFEKRYGKDKGMNVKMAVATKMAKKETEEGVKFYRDITSKDLLENKFKDEKDGAQHFSKVDETEYVWNFVYDDFGRTKLTTEPDKATHLVYTMEGLDNPKLLKISEREILDYKKGENNELSKK